MRHSPRRHSPVQKEQNKPSAPEPPMQARQTRAPNESSSESSSNSTSASSSDTESETTKSRSVESPEKKLSTRYKMKGLGSLLKMYSKAFAAIEHDYQEMRNNDTLPTKTRRSKLIGLRRKMQGILYSLSDTLSQAADDIEV